MTTRTSPPANTGLSHWSSRELAAFIKRTEGVYVAQLTRDGVVAKMVASPDPGAVVAVECRPGRLKRSAARSLAAPRTLFCQWSSAAWLP